MKKIIIFTICCAFIFSFLGMSFAQSAQEEIDYSYGKIVSITEDKIELNEYNYDKNEEVSAAYLLTSDLELRNVNSLKDLSIGDNIEVDYIIKDNVKILKTITLDKDSREDQEDMDNP